MGTQITLHSMDWNMEHVLWTRGTNILQSIFLVSTPGLLVYIALWVNSCLKVEIEEFARMFPSGPIFMNLNYFRQNIWTLSSV